MINILILKFPYSSNYGGGEKHTLTLVEEFKKRGFKFYLVSSCKVLLKEFQKREWPYQKIWAGIEPVSLQSVIIFPLLTPFIFIELFFILAYYKIFKKIKIIYCLSFTEKILAVPIAKILNLKIIWAEHVLPTRWFYANPFKILYILWSRWVKIFTISEAVKKQLVNFGVRGKNVQAIYYGLDSQDFTPQSKSKDLTSKFIIGTIARLSSEKGVDILIRATKMVQAQISNLQVWIIGEGEEKEKLESLTKELNLENQVKFWGFQKNFKNFLKNFDIFILPSIKREALGITLLEALAYQKPVIASNLGGIPEIIEDQKTGLLVEPGNPQTLAEIIIKLYKNPPLAQNLAQAGYQKVKTQFSQEKMIEKFYNLFLK